MRPALLALALVLAGCSNDGIEVETLPDETTTSGDQRDTAPLLTATTAETTLLPPTTPKAPPITRPTTTVPAPATTAASECHPSYRGSCVPSNVSDVDCAGGSGNGPAYTGRVEVVGPDEYDLDRDGNGVGCE